MIRDELKMILELEEVIEFVGTADSGQEAIAQCNEKLPEVVLMDIRCPLLMGFRQLS